MDVTLAPDWALCPITRCVMDTPVMASDGYSYEKEALERWLRINPVSPITKAPCTITNIDYNLRGAINYFLDKGIAPVQKTELLKKRAEALIPENINRRIYSISDSGLSEGIFTAFANTKTFIDGIALANTKASTNRAVADTKASTNRALASTKETCIIL